MAERPLMVTDVKQMDKGLLNPCNKCDLDPQTCGKQFEMIVAWDSSSRAWCIYKPGGLITRVEVAENGQGKAFQEVFRSPTI